MLTDHGAGPGLFLVRESSQTDAYAVSVCSAFGITHHLLQWRAPGPFKLDDVPCPSCMTLEDVGGGMGVDLKPRSAESPPPFFPGR